MQWYVTEANISSLNIRHCWVRMVRLYWRGFRFTVLRICTKHRVTFIRHHHGHVTSVVSAAALDT